MPILPKHARPCGGFTAIELLLVVAVTAIIGALGLSAFRTYVARAQIADGVALAATVQEHVARAFRKSGVPPADRHAAHLSLDPGQSPGSYVESIDVADGRVDIAFAHTADPAIAGQVLSLTPFETADQRIIWVCGDKVPGVGLKPLGFAGGSRQAVQIPTMIEARYLPSTCR